MQKGHFRPLDAGKWKNKGILGPWNKVFHVLWPPEAKKDPSAFNTKKFDFENNFFAFYVKRSYLASGGQKTAKERVFGSNLGPRNTAFDVYWPPGAKNDPSSENTKKKRF